MAHSLSVLSDDLNVTYAGVPKLLNFRRIRRKSQEKAVPTFINYPIDYLLEVGPNHLLKFNRKIGTVLTS